MKDTLIKENIVAQIEKLPYELQLRVFEFLKTLLPKDVAGKTLLKFEGTIDAADLQLMSEAIEEICDKVDINERIF